MNNSYIIKCADKLSLDVNQKKVLETAASDLKIIKQSVPIIKEIIVRGGFLVDLILKNKAGDIDLFYVTHDKKGNISLSCQCDYLKKEIAKLNLNLVGKRHKLDLGHFGKNEIYLPPIEKICGYFSHHIDYISQFCLDENNNIWGNQDSLKHIKAKHYEIRYEGWVLWPYFLEDAQRYNLAFTGTLIRGLRFIKNKRLNSCGPKFKELVKNSAIILKEIAKNESETKIFKKWLIRARLNDPKAIEEVLKKIEISNPEKILDTINKLI